MTKRRSSYRRQKEPTELTRKRAALEMGHASFGSFGRVTHDLWGPHCLQARLDGHSGPLCLGCDILRDALRSLKPSGK